MRRAGSRAAATRARSSSSHSCALAAGGRGPLRRLLPIWLFAIAELEDIFRRCGLAVVDRIGIHQCTNLVPSPLLHRPDPGPLLSALFDILRRLDRRLGRTWPFWRLGCSVAYCLRKPERNN